MRQCDLFGGCQRWRERRDSYRPAGETINPFAFDVAPIAEDRVAKLFVEQHHYSATYPAARFRVGLYTHGHLVGVAVFSHPCNDRVLTSVFPEAPATAATELGRFVLLDFVPANGETWFLRRCFDLLKAEGIIGVVSFSDPAPRRTADGRIVHPGHVGTIYQAHNAAYLGRGTARALRLLPDGTVLSARAIQKIRAGETGWKYSAAILERHGADPCPADGRLDWLHDWLPRLTRPFAHAGNHRYAWALTRRVSTRHWIRQPYPKAA